MGTIENTLVGDGVDNEHLYCSNSLLHIMMKEEPIEIIQPYHTIHVKLIQHPVKKRPLL